MRKAKTMKKLFILVLSFMIVMGMLTVVYAEENTVKKYSFNSGVTAEGWTKAYSQVYDDTLGYGFDEPNGWSAGVITKTASTSSTLNGAMVGIDTEDTETLNAVSKAVAAVKGDTEVNFYVKLPAGTYNVIVYAGGISQNNTYDFNRIYVNGEE